MYRWLFELCRYLGRPHPDQLLAELDAWQLFEWWLLWNQEPWGDDRADLRAWAAAKATWGAEGVRLFWPYVDLPMTAAEIAEGMQEIEDAIRERKGCTDDDRRENLNRD